MTAGSKVRYDRAHWAWMVAAGKAMPRHLRSHFIGEVLETDGLTCKVAWNTGDGRPWPFISAVEKPTRGTWNATVHLRENLEVVGG